MYSPMTEYLKSISQKLSTTGIPVEFKLPDESVKEPFYVIGAHTGDDSPSAKFGAAIVDTSLQIDLFYPTNSRTNLEEAIFQTKIALNKRISHQVLTDNSIGREVYHVVFRINDLIF
ncbi:hypothetical protein [Enterococcus thailandicus]|uniref:hypothetical protein n=1 Tax=Enterococcus thailandicus TaxID=417368 RepID=UPI00244D891D|nr:hypothetical protein K2F_06540 [Enterococcus thailandicus]